MIVALAVGSLLALLFVLPAETRERDRTLKLYFGHTGERGEFTFKRNGRYDRRELKRINHFLRDWRQKEDASMDPHLLDVVWEIYRESGSRDYIHVISAYRSPKTNAMLRSRSSGVAKQSQHMLGKAMDWYLPDVPLDRLRAIAMKRQGGGVGYYPTSGSPFVHTDTGSVRAWPRMSREQLVALFPSGDTLHLPPDGKPLKGYDRALARRNAGETTTVAFVEESDVDEAEGASDGERRGVGKWLKRVFRGDGEEGGNEADTPTAPVAEPQMVASTAEATAGDGLEPRMPRPRPGSELAMVEVAALPLPEATTADAGAITLAFAPIPRSRPDSALAATDLRGAPAEGGSRMGGIDALAYLASHESGTPSLRETIDDPVTLAFAAVDDSAGLPSDEDSARLAAFAALRAQAAPGAESVLTGQATAPSPHSEPTGVVTGRPLALATARTSASAEPQPEPEEVAAGIVLPPQGMPAYDADQDAMRDLIDAPAAYDPQFTQLEMPAPEDGSSIYRAPEAAAAVSETSTPLPADGFAVAPTSEQSGEQGFFMRLFASLIE
jgi:uncharacterized protein YcbK (DUF882 family)